MGCVNGPLNRPANEEGTLYSFQPQTIEIPEMLVKASLFLLPLLLSISMSTVAAKDGGDLQDAPVVDVKPTKPEAMKGVDKECLVYQYTENPIYSNQTWRETFFQVCQSVT